jgi:hypothetical protein
MQEFLPDMVMTEQELKKRKKTKNMTKETGFEEEIREVNKACNEKVVRGQEDMRLDIKYQETRSSCHRLLLRINNAFHVFVIILLMTIVSSHDDERRPLPFLSSLGQRKRQQEG